MKILSKLFRSKPAAKTILSPESGRAIAEATIRTLFDVGGLEGFVLACMEAPGAKRGEIVVSAHGSLRGLTAGLSGALSTLLTSRETKNAALMAILAALQQSGTTIEMPAIQGPNGCDCPICTIRRSKEVRQPTSTTH